jgi:large subunit ribosomal protein L25
LSKGIPASGGAHNTFATIVGRSSRRFTLPAATFQIMSDSTKLSLTARDPEGSRSTRRLRRSGNVPGVIYGGDGEPSHFAVDARILRNTLAHSGAILDVDIDGGKPAPVLVKDLQRHPVRGDIMHVDFLRVNMNETIQTTVVLELLGVDEAPGVVEGGVLSQETRELNVEALPGDIPDVIQHDVSGLEMNATLLLGAVSAPDGVTFLDDPEETLVATITPPTVEKADDDIETETGLVGDDAVAEGQAEGDTAEEAAQSAEASDES